MAKKILPPVFILLSFALAAALACLLMTELGSLIPAAADALGVDADTSDSLHNIFGQLADAEQTPHFLIPAVLAVVLALLRTLLPPKNGGVTFLYCLLGFLMWLAAFGSALLFSRINGIRILDVAASLIDLIRGGVLEIL